MSLINNMLRDLDKRRAGNDARKGIPNEVRPLPMEASGDNRVRYLVLGGALVLAVAYSAWQWRSASLPVLPAPIPSPLPAKPIAAAATPVAVSAVLPAPTLVASAPVPVPAPAPVRAVQADVRRFEPVALFNSPPALTEEPLAPPKPEPKEQKEQKEKKAAASPTPEKPKAPTKAAPTVVERAIVGNLRLEPRLMSKPQALAEHNSRKPIAASVPEEDGWRRAQTLLREQHPDQAEAILRRIVLAQPAHAAARQALLGVMLSAKRTAEMVSVLREGLLLTPEETGWAMSLARLQAEANDYPAAWETLSRSASHAQQQADYQAFCGTVLQRLNRSGDALPYYRNALRLKPREGRWWAGMGIALEAEGKLAEARESYQRARATGDLPAEVLTFVEQKLR
jgi:MSHA biogenesis protein MshN